MTDYEFIKSIMKQAVSDDYVQYIMEVLYYDILDDIKTSADEDYNEDDVRLSIGRVLMDKLGIEK